MFASTPSPASIPIVELDQIGVTYTNGVTALRSISLQLRRGEFTIVLGASGAGKSTLLRVINHLTPPTTGQVIVPGVGAITNGAMLRSHRRQTGMIFQQHQLLASHSALQNVLTGRLAYYSFWRSLLPLPQSDQTLALACLDRVGLLDKALTPVKYLSGGQKQRVGIARALTQQPRLLLADEPIASLDPARSHAILSLLQGICRDQAITALVSLHQIEFATAYGDRILGLAQGQIVFDGSPADLTPDVLHHIYQGQMHPDQMHPDQIRQGNASLEFGVEGRAGEGNHISDVGHARHKLDQTLKP